MKRIFAILLCAAMLITSLAACAKDKKGSTSDGKTDEKIDIGTDIAGSLGGSVAPAVKVGDTLTLGSFEQDNNTENGAEEIEWIVLEVEDGKALLISKYALYCLPYNERYGKGEWKDCSLRAWMNGDFKNEAFGKEETERICSVTLKNEIRGENGNVPASDTVDMVFALSVEEAEQYFAKDEARATVPTPYAHEMGAHVNNYCLWWLRSPGSQGYFTSYVDETGAIAHNGVTNRKHHYAVRPAMWITVE